MQSGRFLIQSLVSLCLLLAHGALAGSKETLQLKPKTVLILVAPSIQSNTVDRIAGSVKECFSVDVCISNASIYFAANGSSSAGVVTQQVPDLCLVLLDDKPLDRNDRRLNFSNAERCVKVSQLKEGLENSSADNETYLRRLEKESLFRVGKQLGLPPCTFLWCAMYPAFDLQELDQKARDLCPPCQGLLQSLMSEAATNIEAKATSPGR